MSSLLVWRGRKAFLLVMALLLSPALSLGAIPAGAHSELVSSSPADGATVTSLTQVDLVFGEAISPEYTTFVLTDSMGMKPTLGEPTYDVTKTHVTIPVTGLLMDDMMATQYKFAYSVLSVDGHTVAGSISFTVSGSTDSVPTSAAPTSTQTDDNSGGAGSTTNWPLWFAVIGAILGAAIVAVIAWVMRRNSRKQG